MSYKKILGTCLLFMGLLEAKCYQQISTIALQKEVEKRSIAGTLPYEMGLELIKRWSKR